MFNIKVLVSNVSGTAFYYFKNLFNPFAFGLNWVKFLYL